MHLRPTLMNSFCPVQIQWRKIHLSPTALSILPRAVTHVSKAQFVNLLIG